MTKIESMTVQSQDLEFSSQGIQSPQNKTPQNECLNDVGIHDDLAISDSDEEQIDSKLNQPENANDNDADLWF